MFPFDVSVSWQPWREWRPVWPTIRELVDPWGWDTPSWDCLDCYRGAIKYLFFFLLLYNNNNNNIYYLLVIAVAHFWQIKIR